MQYVLQQLNQFLFALQITAFLNSVFECPISTLNRLLLRSKSLLKKPFNWCIFRNRLSLNGGFYQMQEDGISYRVFLLLMHSKVSFSFNFCQTIKNRNIKQGPCQYRCDGCSCTRQFEATGACTRQFSGLTLHSDFFF